MTASHKLFPTLAALLLTPATLADDYTGWQTKNPDWGLVFSDDFDGNVLDTSKWNKIDYVSCNSATLARDIALLKEKGFNAKKVTPADLFPRTIHCEAIAFLVRHNR